MISLAEFGSRMLEAGQVGNPGTGKYAGQCVSLIQQLLDQVMSISFVARGNAKDWANNPDVLSHFNKFAPGIALQPGDILVYGSNYGGGYGHIGFIDVNGKFFDQNGVRSLHTGFRDYPFCSYICVLRCKTNFTLRDVNSFEVRVDKNIAMVRSAATSQSSVAGTGTLYKDNTFVATGTIQGENVGGNDVWYKSARGNYVWSGGLSKI